jgi:hypothetical protein
VDTLVDVASNIGQTVKKEETWASDLLSLVISLKHFLLAQILTIFSPLFFRHLTVETVSFLGCLSLASI